MKKALLKMLLNDVKKVNKKHFDMTQWKDEKKCGTVGCAVGTFCIKHPRAQLRILDLGDNIFEPSYNTSSGFDAVADYFGISFEESRYLFDPWNYRDEFGNTYNRVTKDKVIKRIEKFIKTGKMET